MDDPLNELVITGRQPAFAVEYFVPDQGWIISFADVIKSAAIREMERNKDIAPNFDYRCVPCVIIRGDSTPRPTHIKAHRKSANDFNRGDRVKLSPEGRRVGIRPRNQNVFGVVASSPKKAAYVAVRWDGHEKSSIVYAVRFIRKVSADELRAILEGK